jgi:hypothetical protein
VHHRRWREYLEALSVKYMGRLMLLGLKIKLNKTEEMRG